MNPQPMKLSLTPSQSFSLPSRRVSRLRDPTMTETDLRFASTNSIDVKLRPQHQEAKNYIYSI